MGSEPDPASAPRRPSSRRGKPTRAADGSAGLPAAPSNMESPETARGLLPTSTELLQLASAT